MYDWSATLTGLSPPELAGDLTVIYDESADSLTAIISSRNEPEQLRAQAAISLGAVLNRRRRMDSSTVESCTH